MRIGSLPTFVALVALFAASALSAKPPAEATARPLTGVYAVQSLTHHAGGCETSGKATRQKAGFVAVQFVDMPHGAHLRLRSCISEAECLSWAADPWNTRWHQTGTGSPDFRAGYREIGNSVSVTGRDVSIGAFDEASKVCKGMELVLHELRVDREGALLATRSTHRFDGPQFQGQEEEGAKCHSATVEEVGPKKPCSERLVLKAKRVKLVPACANKNCSVKALPAR